MGLDIVELVMAIEDGFGIAIADDEANHASTVGDLYSIVLSKLKDRNEQNAGRNSDDPMTGVGSNEVWEKLCQIIVDQTGIEREQISAEARIEMTSESINSTQ